jgi:hypothetical protein
MPEVFELLEPGQSLIVFMIELARRQRTLVQCDAECNKSHHIAAAVPLRITRDASAHNLTTNGA